MQNVGNCISKHLKMRTSWTGKPQNAAGAASAASTLRCRNSKKKNGRYAPSENSVLGSVDEAVRTVLGK